MEEQIYKLGQKVYITLNGVYNDVQGNERTAFVEETIDWANQYLEELEIEADWSWLRENQVVIGVANTAAPELPLGSTISRLTYNWERPVLMHCTDGKVIPWKITSPNQIYNTAEHGIQGDRVAIVGRKMVFSRALSGTEIGSTVRADVIKRFPEVSLLNTASIQLVRPTQLLVLGIAKNQVLPDVVNNVLTANYDVKYERLLKRAILVDGATTEPDQTQREDLSFIGRVG